MILKEFVALVAFMYSLSSNILLLNSSLLFSNFVNTNIIILFPRVQVESLRFYLQQKKQNSSQILVELDLQKVLILMALHLM